MILKTEISKLFAPKQFLFLLKLVITLAVCGIAIWLIDDHFSSIQMKEMIIQSFLERPYFIVLVVFLSFFNWGIESVKWQVALPKSNKTTFLDAFNSVLVGLGVSLLLPRLLGETVGRYNNHKGDKKDVVSSLALTKIAQGVVTVLFGVFGVYYFKEKIINWFQFPSQLALLFVGLVAIILYLFKKQLIQLIKSNAYFGSFREMNERKGTSLLLLSTVRYFTFYGQFVVLCLFLNVKVNWVDLFFALATLYFVRMATVSLNIVVDLGVRFATAFFVFTALNIIPDSNEVLVLLSLVWLFNVVLPSFVGGLLILRKK